MPLCFGTVLLFGAVPVPDEVCAGRLACFGAQASRDGTGTALNNSIAARQRWRNFPVKALGFDRDERLVLSWPRPGSSRGQAARQGELSGGLAGNRGGPEPRCCKRIQRKSPLARWIAHHLRLYSHFQDLTVCATRLGPENAPFGQI
jgi:hypothetical protein